MLTESYGLPSWGSYAVFGVATVVVGLLLGLVRFCPSCEYEVFNGVPGHFWGLVLGVVGLVVDQTGAYYGGNYCKKYTLFMEVSLKRTPFLSPNT